MRRTISNKTAAASAALPVLYGAQSAKFISSENALEDSLNVAQVALRTAIAETLNKLGVRFSAGTDRLAQLVRTDQDLTAEAGRLDKQILEAVSREPSKRDAAMEQKTRDRMAVVARERDQLHPSLLHETVRRAQGCKCFAHPCRWQGAPTPSPAGHPCRRRASSSVTCRAQAAERQNCRNDRRREKSQVS
jgi:hypothetical protein